MRLAACICFASLTLASAVVADPVEDFYRGKTATVIVATSAGGDYDTRARLVARHIGPFIPGRPNFVVQNMPGGGGIRAANFVFNSAPRDGTMLLALEQQAPLIQALGTPGVEFDLRKGSFIGNTSSSPIVLVSWGSSPVKTLEDAFETELVLGATGGGSASAQIPAMLTSILGVKFRTVAGYPGGNEIYLAMEKGEVSGRATQNWAGWKAQKPGWIADKKLNLLAQGGAQRLPDLADVPLLREFARNDADKQLIDFFLAPDDIARSLVVGPEVPADRVTALRRAFDRAVTDPLFVEEAERLRLDINAMSGEQVTRVVAQILDSPPAVKERARSYMSFK